MESNFTSVVRFAPQGQWPKIANHQPFAQLHAKFWGISMLHEEQEWRNSQQPISAVGDELETDDRMDMDFDLNDVGADVIPGCYVLNIDIEGIERSKIWIRADYIRVYNYLETINDGTSKAEGVAPSATITGQPGIGEFPFRFIRLVPMHALCGKGRASGCIMCCADALQKGSQSSGIGKGLVCCLSKKASIKLQIISAHPSSTNSSGLLSIPTNPRRAFQPASFHMAPAYS